MGCSLSFGKGGKEMVLFLLLSPPQGGRGGGGKCQTLPVKFGQSKSLPSFLAGF